MNYIINFEISQFVDAAIDIIREGLFDGRKDLEALECHTIRVMPNAVNKCVVRKSKQQTLNP